jgi:hypothetical protein
MLTEYIAKVDGLINGNYFKSAEVLKAGKYTFVVEKNGVIISARRGPGVKPVLMALEKSPTDLENASVADTVTGRAAAMLLSLGKVRSVFSQVLSRHAKEYLEENGIEYQCDQLVDAISNRTGDGLCL